MEEKQSKVLFMPKKAYFVVLFISVAIINISSIANGYKRHENWILITGVIGFALITIAGILMLVKVKRGKQGPSVL